VNNKGILFKTWDTNDLLLYDNTILVLNHLYTPSGMSCPLILCREKIMSRAEGPNTIPRSTKERIKDGMTKV
jgi:hypothetical protein